MCVCKRVVHVFCPSLCSFACNPVSLSLSICRVVVYISCPDLCTSFVSIPVCLSVGRRFIYPVQACALQLLVFLSLSVSVCLFVCIPVRLYPCMYICLSVCLHFFVFVYECLYCDLQVYRSVGLCLPLLFCLRLYGKQSADQRWLHRNRCKCSYFFFLSCENTNCDFF